MNNIFDRMVTASNGSPVAGEDRDSQTDLPDASTDVETDSACETPLDVKRVTQELLRHGFVEESEKQDLFRLAVLHERAVNAALEPLDLRIRLDTHRGVAFLVIESSISQTAESDDPWAHPLVRRQRLTLEQSILVAILRQAFIIHEQECGVGQGNATMSVDDLLPQFSTYFGDSGSDAKNESKLLSVLDQLKPHGIVSEVDTKQEITIRPLIAYLANSDSLAALLEALRANVRATEVGGPKES
jgi:uncharacterized protein DUF4194